MSALVSLLFVLALGTCWWSLVRRARRHDGERTVWLSHAAAVGLLTVGAAGAALVHAAGAPVRWEVAAAGAPALAAVGCMLRGLVHYARVHSVTSDRSAWLLAVSCVLALAAVGDLLVERGVLRSPLSALELQFRLLMAGGVGVVWGLLLDAGRRAGLLRAASTHLLLVAAAGVVCAQLVAATRETDPCVRLLLALSWIALAAAVARAAHLPDRSTGLMAVSPLAATVTAVAALLVAVAVITVGGLDARGGLEWSSAWAVLAVLGLSGRVAHLVRAVSGHDRARHEARTDDLTGLPNRRAFSAALEAATAGGLPAALVLADLDGFKEVNDRFGHETGDRLLRHVSQRFRAALPPGTFTARLGGDEFAILLTGGGCRDADAVARRLVEVAGEAELDGVRTAGCSVGVAVAPTGADGAAGAPLPGPELLRRADAAMYVAKGRGGGVALHDDALDRELRERAALTDDLRAAFADASGQGAGQGHEQFVVHYQPQVSAADGRVVGVEALVRWQHPSRGLVPPFRFLDLVEQQRLMPALTARVLARAAADLARWRAAGHDLRLSFNVSSSQLAGDALLDLLDDVVATGTDPSRLVVEVTETTLVGDPDRALAVCQAIRDRGCELSIDDFGTGYSSLGYLSDFPATEVKVDRSFTARLLTSPRTAAVVAGTVGLAHHLGMRVVAEGVEDAATLAELRRLGCDLTQGYLHSRPVPAGELLRSLAASTPSAPAPIPSR
ncbi:putative bifunctional diguanylate cyclase/phosphodiesterase [Kineococcus sp. SYSU DK006]|uniref:putative bifunctional diguanylate cyclase/phosphodiesterase n=1 Tax=Kineococcus sp. SYSU DK006 TaxID=3383127 RepID=UPI003D7E2EE1